MIYIKTLVPRHKRLFFSPVGRRSTDRKPDRESGDFRSEGRKQVLGVVPVVDKPAAPAADRPVVPAAPVADRPAASADKPAVPVAVPADKPAPVPAHRESVPL